MTKSEFKDLLKLHRLKQWEIAEEIGMQESYFCKLLRHDLSEALASRITKAIETLSTKN